MIKFAFLSGLVFLFSACFSLKNQAENIQYPTDQFDTLVNFKSAYVSPRTITIWKPKDYSVHKKYAVLYMHDGQMLFDSTNTWNNQEWHVDETMNTLLASKQIKETIIVAINNNPTLRHSEYFPQKPFESLNKDFQDSLLNEVKRYGVTDLFGGQVQSDNYLQFIVKELKPYVDSHYSTRKNAENTFIAGSSMGGLISLYAICEYPDVFGGAACLSTHWPGIFSLENNPIPESFISYLSKALPPSNKHKIYFDFGTATLDALYEVPQLKVDSLMRLKGYSKDKWMTKKYEGADHSEKSWAQRLSVPFTFLLKN
jgi:predicted alpha/beta superfamily hydrolase